MIGFFKKYVNYIVWLITFVFTLLVGIHLCRNGTSVSWTVSGSKGGPAGNSYTWEPYMLIIILAMVVVAGIGVYLRKVVSRKPALNWYWCWLDSFLANPTTTVPWAIFLFTWLFLFDFYNLLSDAKVPPLGRIVQLAIEEMKTGRLFSAMSTTMLRNGLALMLASIVSIILIVVLGEYRKLFQRCIPHMRVLALIPPLLLFSYASYLDKHLGWLITLSQHIENVSLHFLKLLTKAFCLPESLCHIWFPQETRVDPVNVFSKVFGMPGRMLLLSSLAIWPLLIFGLYQYHKVSDALHIEIKKYRLPPIKAMIVKMQYVIRAISPAFYIAIVLIFVSCVEIEMDNAKAHAIDGVASFYMYYGYLNNNDLLVLGVCILIFLGLVFIGVWDMIAFCVCRLRHVQFEGEFKKKGKRRLL